MTTKSRCLEVLASFLVQPGEREAVAGGAPLFTSSSIDSLTLVNMVVALEQAFSTDIDAEDLEATFKDIDSLASYIDAKLTT
jgi:acyl carrier protein